MFAQNHLSLRLVRLKPGEAWSHQGEGFCFAFPNGGAGTYILGSATLPFGPGDVLVVNNSVHGKLRVPDTQSLTFWCFSLSLEHLLPLFGANEIALLQAVTETFAKLKRYEASNPLAIECHKLLKSVPPQFDLAHRVEALKIAALIVAAEFRVSRCQRVGFVRVEQHLTQVFERLSGEEVLTLSAEDLAGRFGCSRRHLTRLFHQHFGFSIAALRMEMRLLKAVSLLRDPSAKVINVAEQCGFNHLSLFNICFKRRFGTSPGQWRKKSPANENASSGQKSGEETCPLRINGFCPMNRTAATGTSTAPPVPQVPFTLSSSNLRHSDPRQVTNAMTAIAVAAKAHDARLGLKIRFRG